MKESWQCDWFFHKHFSLEMSYSESMILRKINQISNTINALGEML